jgi:hypothetical protein
MSPKAYDEETERGLLVRDHDEVLVSDEHSYRAVFAPLRNVSLGEALTVLGLLYVCTIAAFNAAYFSNIPDSFAEFFSISDLVQTNIPMIEYFISVTILYFIVATAMSFATGIFDFDLRSAIRDISEPIIVKLHLDSRRFWIAYGFLFVAFHITSGMLGGLGVTNFSVAMTPTLIFQGVFLYFFWVGYKFQLMPLKALIVGSMLSLFISSYNAGFAWLRSQIATPAQVQTIQDKDGLCLERTILRNSSSGFLLYDPSTKQFEFRSKDAFKTIYNGRDCI